MRKNGLHDGFVHTYIPITAVREVFFRKAVYDRDANSKSENQDQNA